MEPTGSVRACTGIVLPVTFYVDGQKEKKKNSEQGAQKVQFLLLHFKTSVGQI
jgi:hypothetical protein